jgi:hypothetical protein
MVNIGITEFIICLFFNAFKITIANIYPIKPIYKIFVYYLPNIFNINKGKIIVKIEYKIT